jgi:hypothetical protein
MTKDQYINLFHELELNRVAFKRLMDCDDEVLRLVNRALEIEREACAQICESLAQDRGMFHPDDEEFKTGVLAGAGMCGVTIRARSNK